MLYDLAEVNNHIVDLKRSRWNKDMSVREKGIYIFDHDPEAKVYIKVSDYQDSAARPDHILKFIDTEKLPYYRAKFGAEPVTIHDRYWPEPMVPNAEGQYVIMDALLVKIANMEDYLDFRAENRARGNKGHLEEDKRFDGEARSEVVRLTDADISNVENQSGRQTEKH